MALISRPFDFGLRTPSQPPYPRRAPFQPGELHWLHFKQCLSYIGSKTLMETISGVPRSELVPVVASKNRKKQEWDDWNLSSHTKDVIQKDMKWMQRQLFIMADRAKETTSLSFASVGQVFDESFAQVRICISLKSCLPQGVTTGTKKMRKETMNVYCKPLRAKTTRLHLPKFEKSRESQKKELAAKEFFNLVDADKSGTLSKHELKSALVNFGFSDEERDTIFSLVDADGSGSVTLNEFCQGLSNTNIEVCYVILVMMRWCFEFIPISGSLNCATSCLYGRSRAGRIEQIAWSHIILSRSLSGENILHQHDL
jgi:hypothetical protein